MLIETTKYLSVSTGAPGPASCSHQPGSSLAPRVTWVSPVSACSIRTALERVRVEGPPGLVGEDDVRQPGAGFELQVADPEVLDGSVRDSARTAFVRGGRSCFGSTLCG